jgi:hypothetical protein
MARVRNSAPDNRETGIYAVEVTLQRGCVQMALYRASDCVGRFHDLQLLTSQLGFSLLERRAAMHSRSRAVVILAE